VLILTRFGEKKYRKVSARFEI